MDRKKQEAIAIFRYGVIAPVLHGSSQNQADYFRQLAEKPLQVPFAEPRHFRPSTFKAWLLHYRKEGFEGLLPRSRSDCGVSRVISAELSQLIGQILSEHPTLAVVDLRERLIRLGQITSRRISENTLRRHIAQQGLRPSARSPIQARKRFEKPHANDLWTLDFMHGPRLPLEARRKPAKTYLLAAIDDHSRFLTSARFYAQENSATVAAALKEAFSRHGLPKILYCDNASAFSSRQLRLACARLGVALVHSRPYDAASRGKIERFFRSLRQRFLAALPTCASLAELNTRFQDWLQQDYHRRLHRGIGESPLDRYLRSLAQVPPRRPSRDELDHLFFRSFTRTAAPDATVSIDHVLWELPSAYSGQKVEIRHPEGKPQELYLFDQQRLVCRLQRVNLTENASRPRPLRFSLQEEPDP
jgi:transposase InsO family protein